MKLCLVTSIFPLPGESPSVGPDNVVFNLIKGLKKLKPDISIEVVTIRKDINHLIIDDRLFPNVRIHYYPGFKFLPRSLQDPIIVKKFVKQYDFDIIHSHSPVALAKILDFDTPKILTLHGIYWKEKLYVKNLFLRLSFYNYNTYMFKKIFSKVDAFIAISPYVLDEIKSMNISGNYPMIFQINNPIDDSFFMNPSNKKTNNIIFHPGVIRSLKNQITSINVINTIKDEIPDLKLILAGSISESKYFKKIHSIVNENNLFNNVEYLGSVSRSEMLDLYSKSSIVYLLSNHEVQPMVVLEAMATGTPVIASNLKSISNLIDDGVTGYLVDPQDKKKIVELTLDLLKNENRRSIMGNQAKEVAKRKFSSDIIAKQTLDMYDSILSSKN
jgi:glycosyltransferase involved in cell wall biosynthesis